MITTMSLYFIFSNKNFAYKLISIILYLFIVLYTFASSSRQSIIFILLSSLIFILFNLKYRSICYLIVFCIILLWGSGYVVDNFNINREVAEKFLGGDINTFFESNRMNKIQEGFDLLYLHEIFVGAGIGSVPFSGPHNDFVRWIQRSGIFVGLLGFLPFFLIFVYSIKSYIRTKANIFIFIMISAYFTIYTSFFGYPRDDTFQSAFVFLGLILYYAFDRNTCANKTLFE